MPFEYPEEVVYQRAAKNQAMREENERLRAQLGAITTAALAVICEYRRPASGDGDLLRKIQVLSDTIPGGFTE